MKYISEARLQEIWAMTQNTFPPSNEMEELGLVIASLIKECKELSQWQEPPEPMK